MCLYEALAKVAVCLFKVKATDGTPAAMNANGFLSVLRLALVFGIVEDLIRCPDDTVLIAGIGEIGVIYVIMPVKPVQ